MTNKMLVRIRVWISAWIKIYIRTRNYYRKTGKNNQVTDLHRLHLRTVSNEGPAEDAATGKPPEPIPQYRE